jgi:uncharacterized protein involved in exopolysaccharide biosynthesis
VAVSKPAIETGQQREIDVMAIARVLWAHWLLILCVVIACAAVAIYLAFTAVPRFRADVTVTEVRNAMGQQGQIAGQLGGLASLVGFNLGEGEDRDAAAVLESRWLVEQFITRNNLLRELTPPGSKPRSLWRAVQDFQRSILSIRQDPRKGVTTISIEWTDPAAAARWANDFVALANELIRNKALTESKRNLAYLSEQIDHTNVVELRRVLFNLVENETKTVMLASGRPEYAFRTVDPAVPPEIRSSPRRTLILGVGIGIGLVLGALIALLHDLYVRQRAGGPALRVVPDRP